MKPLVRPTVFAALLATASVANAGLVFNFTFTAGTSAQAIQGFVDAGARWSNVLTDNVVLDMTVGTASLGSGILASTGSRRMSYTYSTFRTALVADSTSGADATAVGNLPGGASVAMLINRTSDNPNGSGSATPYVDTTGANNSTINITTANAKAVGLAVGSGTVGSCLSSCDASIQFSNTFNFDFDPTNGISAGAFDFVGIAAHEIGHALGFISGVDVLDGNSPPVNGPFSADQFTFLTALDLFRYSAQSDLQNVLDFTADTREKFFTLDGGITVGPKFSTGRNFGDGQQASHWKDNLGLGIMDPTAAIGELLAIGANDLMAFDVIGWNLSNGDPGGDPGGVPEPSGYSLLALSLAALGWSRRVGKARAAHRL